MGNISDKNSGIAHQGFSTSVKVKLHQIPPTTKKRGTRPSSPFWIWREHTSHLAMLPSLFSEWPPKLLVLSRAQNKNRLCNESGLPSSLQFTLPLELYDSSDHVFEVSLTGRDAVYSLLKALVGKLKHRPLGSWIKFLPSSADNIFLWGNISSLPAGP